MGAGDVVDEVGAVTVVSSCTIAIGDGSASIRGCSVGPLGLTMDMSTSSSSSPGKNRLIAEVLCPMGLKPSLKFDPEEGMRGRVPLGELTGAVAMVDVGSRAGSSVIEE